jgi:APA family basic amino acid/polyamine antiporter
VAELKKNLGFWTVFSITITAMIGTGMFFGTAFAAKIAGNASILAWVLLGIITVYVGACFGELTSMFPTVGGIYDFTKQAYGKGLTSFLIGWLSWIVINMMNSLLIVAALDYMLPGQFLLKIILSIAIIVVLNYFAYLGTEVISVILGLFAFVILALLISLVYFGVPHVNTANYVPFFQSSPIYILVALFFIVETFFGWENATFMAEETKDAEKTIPRALILSSIVISVLGVMLAIVMLGIIPASTLGQSIAPIADLTTIIFSPAASIYIRLGVALALIGSAAGGLIGGPRLLVGLARDKLFIEQLSEIHPKHQTPYKAIIFQAIVSIIVIMIGFGNYTSLLSLLVPLALLMYISVLVTVSVLRFKKPNHPRPFKVWFGKLGPILVSVLYAAVIIAWAKYTVHAADILLQGASFILFGIPIFMLLVSYYDPDSIKFLHDFFARFSIMFENINLPKNFRRELLDYNKDLWDKTILDYGAGVGTLTMHLAKEVGPRGKIYATDLSNRNIDILQRRLIKRNLNNVEVIYDEHQVNRIHPAIKNVDVVFSVGMLSYVQDVEKVLKEISKILPRNGRICMVEYIDFWFLPNVKWLSSNESIEKIFKSAGFSVHIKKKKKLFWSYLIIYGIKTDENVPYI